MNGMITIRRLGDLVMLLPLVYVLSACATPLTYSSEAIEAKVVDAETKKPIEGVIVVANWQLKEGTLGGSVPAGQLMVMEAITEANGRFAFPAWGPKTTWKGHLVNEDPQLLLYKSGYQYRRLVNTYSSTRESRLRRVRVSDWDGKIIELRPLTGKLESYVEQFQLFNEEIESITTRQPKECNWKEISSVVRVLDRERKQLVVRGANANTLSSIHERLVRNDEYFSSGGCGSPKKFFDEIEQ